MDHFKKRGSSMHIKVKQSKLLKGINIVQRGIHNQSNMPILKGILLLVEGNVLKLISNNMQIAIETEVNAEIIEEGRVVIDSKLLSDLIRKVKDDEIEIKVIDQLKVVIQCSSLLIHMKGFSADEFPTIPKVVEKNHITVSAHILRQMIKKTVFSVSKADTLSAFTGELFEMKNNSLNMVATDMYRIALVKQAIQSDFNDDIKALIPGEALLEINKLLGDVEGDIKISLEEKQALFHIKKTRVVTRLIQGEFLNYESIFPQSHLTKIQVNTSDLLEALEITAIFSQNSNHLVRLNMIDNKLKISSNTEVGDIVKEIDIKLEGKDLEIGFNIRYLLEIIRVIESEFIYMFFSSGVSPCVIKTQDGCTYEYLVLPVRIHNI